MGPRACAAAGGSATTSGAFTAIDERAAAQWADTATCPVCGASPESRAAFAAQVAMSRSRALQWAEALAGTLSVVGAVYFAHSMLAHVDHAAVRTGPLVVYAAFALLVAGLLVLAQIPLVLFALLRRPGIRLRVVVMFFLGISTLAAGFMLGQDRTDRQLPDSPALWPTLAEQIVAAGAR